MQLKIDNLKKRSCAVHSGNEFLPVLIYPLMMRRMIVIDEGRELHQAKLSLTMKSTAINVETKACLVKAWETTP